MKFFKRTLSLLLVFVMCVGLIPYTAFAATNTEGVVFSAALDASTIDTSDATQKVVMTVTANKNFQLDSIGMRVTIPTGWTLENIENEDLGFVPSNLNLEKGIVNYATSDAENWTTNLVAKVTYIVPANVAAGTYELGIHSLTIARDYSADEWESDGSASVTLTVTAAGSGDEFDPDTIAYSAALNVNSIESSDATQKVVMTVTANQEFLLDSIGMRVTIPAGWTLENIENEDLGFVPSNLNLEKGIVNYATSDAENWSTNLIAKVTYIVPANVAPGTYELGIHSLTVAKDYSADEWESDGAASTTLTVTAAPVHVCDPIVKEGQDATCTEDGWMDYFQCADESCGKIYADKGCTEEITDLDAWKAGDGKIAASHNYGDLIEEDAGTHTKDELKDGMRAHYFCDSCDSYFDSDLNPVEEEDLIIKNEHSFTIENGYAEEDGHADTCACGAHDTVAEHEPNIPAATEDEDQICSICEYVMATATGHVHANHLTLVPEEPADCTEDGHLAYYECSCGKAFFEDATGSIEIEDLDAWLDGDGKIAATGHTYDEKIQDEDHLKDEATNCTEYNTYWYDCSVCDANAKDDEDATDKFWTSDVAGDHNFVEMIEDEAHYVEGTGETCQEPKEYYYDCEYCDEIGEETWRSNSVGDHDYNTEEWGYTNKEEGHAHKCKYCDAHDEVQPHIPGAPATEDEDQICTECEIVLVPALGHVHGNHLTPVDEKPATCTEDGYEAYYECSCGEAYFEDADASVEIEDLDAWKNGDGLIPAEGHTYDEKIQDEDHLKDEATNCSECNTYWYDCSVCDANAKDDMDATDKFWTSDVAGDHNFTEQIEDEDHYVEGTGTCQEGKEYYYDCEHCDEMGEDTWVSRTMGDHSFTEEIEDEDHYVEGTGETCQDNKEYYYDCEYCDEIGEDTWVSETVGDHNYGEEWANNWRNHWNECACGDKANEEAHMDNDGDKKCDVCERKMSGGGAVVPPVGPVVPPVEPPVEPPVDTPPQTGDSSMMWLWIVLLVVSSAGVFTTIAYDKKRSVR